MMKTQFFKLIVITMVICLVSCNKEKEVVFTNYKYADKPETITCGDIDTKLLKEALFAFEEDIAKHYKTQSNNISRAYSRFITESTIGRLKFEDVISEHTLNIFEALKKDQTLWDQGNAKSNLNYNSDIINCIGENIKDKRLKSIFNSLKSTNSLSPKLFGEPVKNNSVMLLNDKYLATYVALEFYYAKLFDADLTNINFQEPATNIDFNKIPKEPKTVPITGTTN